MICARLRIRAFDWTLCSPTFTSEPRLPIRSMSGANRHGSAARGENSATADGAVIVAGDFNATPDIQNYRQLLAGGHADAVQQSGAGFDPTYPADRWYPPSVPDRPRPAHHGPQCHRRTRSRCRAWITAQSS